MQGQVAKLAEQLVSDIVRQELRFSRNTALKSIAQLGEQIFQNLITGLLLNQEEPLYCCTLIYRLIHSCDQLNTVSAERLLEWIQDDSAQEYLLKLIAESLTQLGFTDSCNQQESDCCIDQIGQRQIEKVKTQQQINSQVFKQIHSILDLNHLQYKQQAFPSFDQILEVKQDFQQNQQISHESQSPYKVGEKDSSIFFQKDKVYQQDNQFQEPDCKNDLIDDQLNEKDKDRNCAGQNQSSFIPVFVDHLQQVGQQERKNSFQSLNHEAQSDSQEHIKTLKLTDAKRLGEQDQVSEVSSYANDSSFLSSSVYNVQDTSRYGHFLYGDKVDLILRSFVSNSSIFILVRWNTRKNGELPVQSILESQSLKQHCPQKLIEFYEKLSN